MVWFKATKAAEYAGGISVKVLYAAVRQNKCRAAKIGAGRNLIWCEQFIDEWLMGAVERTEQEK